MRQEIRFCKAPDNTRLAYARVGNGPPLVKVANWLSHLEYDWDSPVWQPWLEGWSRYHTFYRYDMRGCGLSDWEVADFSFSALVGDLESIVDNIGLDRFDLFSMSQGGTVSIAYAARHPERVNRLVIYGGYLRGRLHGDPSQEEIEAADLDRKLLKLSWGNANPAYRQVFTMFLIPEATPEQFAWFNNLEIVSTSPGNALEIQRTFDYVDVTGLAVALKVPTLVIHAKDDAAVNFDRGRGAAAQIPGALFASLNSKNHVLMVNEPAWSIFWQTLYDFLGVGAKLYRGGERTAGTIRTPALNLELTPREKEILQFMVAGYQNKDIAQRLFLSHRTVRNYVSSIYAKLEVKNRREAIVWATQRRIP